MSTSEMHFQLNKKNCKCANPQKNWRVENQNSSYLIRILFWLIFSAYIMFYFLFSEMNFLCVRKNRRNFFVAYLCILICHSSDKSFSVFFHPKIISIFASLIRKHWQKQEVPFFYTWHRSVANACCIVR